MFPAKHHGRGTGASARNEHQQKNPGVTEIVEIPGRGHSLTIDSGWPEITRPALAFIRRHV